MRLLPIFKETTEILFQEGLIKVGKWRGMGGKEGGRVNEGKGRRRGRGVGLYKKRRRSKKEKEEGGGGVGRGEGGGRGGGVGRGGGPGERGRGEGVTWREPRMLLPLADVEMLSLTISTLIGVCER